MYEDPTESPQSVSVLGAGSWGTALAHLLAVKGHHVTLWDRDADLIGQLRKFRINSRYMPGFTLDSSIEPVDNIRDAVNERCNWVVLAVSSSGIRDVVGEIAEILTSATALIVATKGLESDTGFSMSELVELLFGQVTYSGLVVLSGPNLASEMVRGIPSAAVCASTNLELARRAQALLMTPFTFRVYTSTDVRGVELGGALKNVLAIAAGISDGLGFGDNTKAALMTRGLMEITQVGTAAGAKPLTFLGLAGVGDLIATAASRLSRNYRVGVGLAERKSIDRILAELGQVAEGIPTTRAARTLARRYSIQMPLFETIYDVVYGSKSPLAAVESLMSRPAKEEFS